MVQLVDFAIVTIFARELLEGSIIIGEYRTIILRGDSLKAGITKDDALREVAMATLIAVALALLVIAAVAIPLAVLSRSFDHTTAEIIEGVSKIVAAVSLLHLSLKLPRFLGVYGSRKKQYSKTRSAPRSTPVEDGELEDLETTTQAEVPEDDGGLSLLSIRFNVAWNIWREVAECGVYLIPFFLSGEQLAAVPLSAVIGSIVGLLLGFGIYYANKVLKDRIGLTIFSVLLLILLSAGLFTNGSHVLEETVGSTPVVWSIPGDFWSVDRLPMTLLKPFGYNNTRTVLEIVCFWLWLTLAGVLHLWKYSVSPKTPPRLRGRTLGRNGSRTQLVAGFIAFLYRSGYCRYGRLFIGRRRYRNGCLLNSKNSRSQIVLPKASCGAVPLSTTDKSSSIT